MDPSRAYSPMSEYNRQGYSQRNIPAVVQDDWKQNIQERVSLSLGWISHYDSKRNDKIKNRDFQIKVLKYDPPLIRKELKRLESKFPLDSNDSLYDLFKYYRELYIEEGSQLTLQLSRLALRLAIWNSLEAPHLKDKPLKPQDYLYYSLKYGASFADWLKKARAYATFSTVAHVIFEDLQSKIDELNTIFREEILSIDIERKYSYDEFLHEQYLLFFDDENVNDFQWAFKPVECTEDSPYIFEETLIQLLERYRAPEIHVPDDSEKSTWISDSSCFNRESLKSVPHRKAMRERTIAGLSEYGQYTNEFRFKRTIIPVAPANFRDSWMSDPDTLYTIKQISYAVRQIVERLPYSAMYDPNIVHKRKSFLRRKEKTLYFLVDYKKSALTVPRYILELMGKCLERVYPEVEAFRYIKYYVGLMVYDNDRWHIPERGVGLGNMNELFTLMQCVFGHLINKLFGTKSIFFNDDAVYELQSDSWKKQIVYILGLIQDSGNILNLAKSVMSESNIFCEEYLISDGEEYDYSKIQSLIIPFADVAFQSTCHEAKKYFYSLDKQLLGTGYRLLTNRFLDLYSDLYTNEFRGMDFLLPYHLGGWKDFSPNNFSCIVEYIVDPHKYLTVPQEEGYIPFIKKWSYYQILLSAKGEGLLSSKAKIGYRGDKLKPPFNGDFNFSTCGPLKQYVYEYTGIQTPEELNDSLEDLINFRGLKNAKPRLKRGLAQKEASRRGRIFRNFLEHNKCYENTFSRNPVSMAILLRLIKSVPDAPDFIAFPRTFVTKWEDIPKRNTIYNSLLIIKKDELNIPSQNNLRRSLNRTLESIVGNRWIVGSDPFIFHDLWRRKKSGYLVSDKPVLREIRYVNPPDFFRAFCPNKKLFIAEIQSRTGQRPVEFLPLIDQSSKFQMHQLKDAFYNVLPSSLKGIWTSILKRFSRVKKNIRLYASSVTLLTEEEFKIFLQTLEQVLMDDLDLINRDISNKKEIPDDVVNLLRRFDDEEIFRSYIRKEYNLDDLLDEEYDADYDYEDDEDSSSDLHSPLYNEEIEGEEDEDLEEYLDPSESRRLMRYNEHTHDLLADF